MGLKRGSWALEQLQADAQQHHMGKQLGKLIALRLTEYYEQQEHGRRPAPRGSRTDQPRSHVSLDEPRVEEQVLTLSETAESNAQDALAYWGSL